MPLIASPRHLPGDTEHWGKVSAGDIAMAGTAGFLRAVDTAEESIVHWTRNRAGYCGVSWGKDSVVVADMCARLINWPLVWIRVDPISNPDCAAVRDEFLRIHPGVEYDEIPVPVHPSGDPDIHSSEWNSTAGYVVAGQRHGLANIRGVRGEESADRRRQMRGAGAETKDTLSPIIRWSADMVYAYLAWRDLPVHPAYAMSYGGALERGRIRVAAIGGSRGIGVGRREWERTYYPGIALT